MKEAGETGWRLYGCEINLRETGTKHAFETAAALLGGPLEGEFRVAGGRRVYLATDAIYDPHYEGRIRPQTLIRAIEASPRLHYDCDRKRGVVLHMFGALLPHGKIGATCIAQTRGEAEKYLVGLTSLLDRLSGRNSGAGTGRRRTGWQG